MTVRFAFDNSYARLPSSFYARVSPTPVSAPHLLKLNQELAVQLGLNPAELAKQSGVEILVGKRIPEGAEPIATVYAGHQFGQFVP
jgi:serine/tyrosine/threonine adenylyltransferase